MATIVALLRGINVGGHRELPMADLREACRDAGFAAVRSYIQSGNLVFDGKDGPDRAEAALEAAIERRFGFAVDVVARTAARWGDYVARNPLAEAAAADPAKMMLALSRPTLQPATVADLRAKATGGEVVEAVGDALYLHFPNGAGRSALAARLGRLPATARNWRTVATLATMAGI